jgi:hypothetical protein
MLNQPAGWQISNVEVLTSLFNIRHSLFHMKTDDKKTNYPGVAGPCFFGMQKERKR